MAPLLSGAVHSATGGPVAGAAVYFTHGPASLPDVAAQTGEDGRFTLHAPEAGDYGLAARGPAGPATPLTVSVQDEDVVGLILTVPGGG